MRRSILRLTWSLGILVSAACSASAQNIACTPQRPVEGRASVYDSTAFQLGGQRALICYGRPSAKGRAMIGGQSVPFGRLWRTGANEPTIIHLPVAATIAGVAVAPGSYSIYSVPGEKEWEVVVNKSISQWGHESRYTPEVQALEVGRGKVAAQKLPAHVETFTITAQPAGPGNTLLLLDWETARIAIPVQAAR